MGIHFTRYGDGLKGEIKFDVDAFDYSYDDDTFPQDAQDDFSDILLEHGQIYYISRPTDTNDSMGHVTASTNESLEIYGMFQDITIKDRKINDMGLAVTGNRKFYYRPSYTNTVGEVESTYELKEGDIITDNYLYTGAGSTGQFRIIKVLKQAWLPNVEIYRTAIAQSINLDGS